MQGIKTPGVLHDPKGERTGWQGTPGTYQDRDLLFFDTVLTSLKHDYSVDNRRIYATGFSNGGFFTYLLWACRNECLAAVAPCAATTQAIHTPLKPKPALHLAGLKDPLVKWEWQEKSMAEGRQANGCQSEGVPWAKEGILTGIAYPSTNGTPFVTLTFEGQHVYPAGTSALIIRFFKEHAQP